MTAATNRIKRLRPRRLANDGPVEEDPPDYCVLGDGHVGVSLARGLLARGHTVALVADTALPADLTGQEGDPCDIEVLRDAGVADAASVIVATSRDSRNLLAAQLVRTHFDVPEIRVLVNAPDRSDVVADAGHEPYCVATLLSAALVDAIHGGESA